MCLCVIVRLLFARSLTIIRVEKKVVDSSPMHWTVLLSNFTLKLRDVSASPTEPSGLHDPHTDICYTGRLNSFFFPSHIFHFCLFPGSTYRAAKIEFLVKFKQGGGLLDNDPRRGISISVHAICRLLEIC